MIVALVLQLQCLMSDAGLTRTCVDLAGLSLARGLSLCFEFLAQVVVLGCRRQDGTVCASFLQGWEFVEGLRFGLFSTARTDLQKHEKAAAIACSDSAAKQPPRKYHEGSSVVDATVLAPQPKSNVSSGLKSSQAVTESPITPFRSNKREDPRVVSQDLRQQHAAANRNRYMQSNTTV